MSRALIIVDVQNDFTEGGSLAVEGGKQVAKDITEYLENNRDLYSLVIATRDWHEPENDNGGHFGDPPDFVDSWPHHCVQGTYGAQYADDFDISSVNVHIVKGMGKPAYSGFEGVLPGSRTTLTEVLKKNEITEIDVVGLAFDYCVKATSIDAYSEGFGVTILKDLTASIVEDDSSIVEELEKEGIDVL